MLDILLSRLKEDIAIDGEEGANITIVWEYTTNILKELTKSVSQKEPTIDDNYKAFLWPHLKRLDSFTFYKKEPSNNEVATKPTVKASTKSTQRGKKKEKQIVLDQEYIEDVYSEEEGEEDKNENMSIVTKDVKYTKIEVKDMGYHQLTQDYGDNISVVASKEFQKKQIYKNVPPVVFPAPKQIEALQAIIRQRSKGIYQTDLAKVLDIDQKAASHYAKTLEEKGAIFRVPISIKGAHTNLCTHVRFKKDVELDYASNSDQRPYNVNIKGEVIDSGKILETIIALGKGASNNMLITRDILYALGFESNSVSVKKWFNRSVEELAIKGYVKKSYTQLDNKGRLVTCVEVLKPAFEMNDASKEQKNLIKVRYPLMIDGAKENGPGFCMDTTIHHQIFKMIEDSGVNGCSNREFGLFLNCDASRLLFKYLERIIDNSTDLYPSLVIKRHFEFQGRRRQFRFFSLKNYNTLVEKKETEIIPFPETEWSENTLKEFDVLKPVVRTRKHLISTNHDYVSSYYKNILACKRKKRPTDEESQPNDLSASEERPTKKSSRATKDTKNKKNSNETAQSGIVTVSIVEEQQSPKNIHSPSLENSKKDEAGNDTAQVNIFTSEQKPVKKRVRPPKKTKKDNMEKEDSHSGVSSISNKPSTRGQTRSQNDSENMDIEIANETPTSSRPEVVTIEETLTPSNLRENITHLSKKRVEHSQPTKQSKKADEKQKNVTHKRTLVDYFGKVSKKQKTTSTTDITEAATSSASINKITSECDESTTSVNNVTQINYIVTGLIEKVDVGLVTYKENKETPAYDSEIVVAEAGPSLMNLKLPTQQSTSNATKTNVLVNPTQVDASTLISDYITTISHTAGDSTNKPELADMNAVADAATSTDNSNIAILPLTPLTPVAIATNPSRKRGNVNSYLELRKTILLDVIHQHEIVEVGKDMRQMFEEAHERIVGKKIPGTVCLKTLWKTCLDLSKNGEAQTKIVECIMLNGKKLTRKVLVRKDIDLEGEKFNEEIDLIRTTRTVMKPHVPATKLERYEAPIERLQDRISKIKEEILEKSDISQSGTFKMVAKLSEYADNASNSVTGQIFFKHGRDTEPKRSFWMITCMNHGWLYGRMLRAKCLYHYLFDLLNRPVRIQGVDKEKRTISLQSIVYNLPCSIFCQIIIIPSWTDEIKAFVDDPDNANKTYDDFPPAVREVFFNYSSHFTKTLRTTLSVLIFLRMVIPRGLNSDRDQQSYISETYELTSFVQIWDFRLKPEFTRANDYNLSTEDDVNNYWKDLHFVAVQPPPQTNDKLAEHLDSLTKESLKSIFTLRNWDNIAVLTKPQRNILSSYVNKYKSYTPISNLGLCRKISEEAGVSVNAVRNYYSKIQVMLDKKLENKNAKRIAREASGNTVRIRNRQQTSSKKYRVNGGHRMINRQTKHIFGGLENRVLTPTKESKYGDQDITKTMDKFETSDKPFMDNMNHIPVIDGGVELKFKRSKRFIWTKQEDDLLIYCYVILQHRAAFNRFMWYAIRQVLPNKKAITCRTRISRLLMKPFNQEYISKCKALWKNAYTQGIKDGDIVDENRTEMVNFDLISQLEYFLRRIRSDFDLDMDGKTSPLPASLSLLSEHYHIHNTGSQEPSFHEIVYHKKTSSISKMQSMYSLSYSIRSGLDVILDYSSSALRLEDDVNGREIKLVMSYCMMVLMTPQEKYDPFITYKSLTSFDEELFRRAVNNLYNSGYTVTTRASRVIPGTKHNLSAKFLQKMANIYPKYMFEQSKQYENYLVQAGRIQLNPHVLSSGMMSCILDLVSRNKLDITRMDNEEQRARIEFSNLARLISRDHTSFDLCIKTTENLDQPEPIEITKKPYVYPLESATFEKLVPALLLSLEKDKKQLTKEIIAYMKERGSLGSVAYELRKHFKNYEEGDIQCCLDNLLQAEPPLLCLVGMDSERYVLTISKYIKSWTIFRDTSNSSKKTDQPPLFQCLIAIIPTLWTDIEGDITSVLFKDCCQTVIGWITSKPGITTSGLHRFLQNLIPRVELNRILKHLIEQKVLKSVAACQDSNGKNGLFSKTRLSHVTKSAKFRRNVETSYFVLPGYYNSLVQ